MNIRFKRRALADLEAIHEYIAPHDPVAAKRVVVRIASAIQRLRDFPLSGRVGPVRGIRLLVISGLPYIVVYRVRPEAVDIIAVVHSARRHRS